MIAALVGVSRQSFNESWLRDVPDDCVRGRGAQRRYHMPSVVSRFIARQRRPDGLAEALKAQRERVKIVKEELACERERMRLARERGELVSRSDLAETDRLIEAVLLALSEQLGTLHAEAPRRIDDVLTRFRRHTDVEDGEGEAKST